MLPPQSELGQALSVASERNVRNIGQPTKNYTAGKISTVPEILPRVLPLANLSTSLAGQLAGVKSVDRGIWLVSFMDYDLGYIDLGEKTLQPLENPFGPKLSPVS